MKPYYDHAGITIYHGDCREILPGMPKVDLVLTDPPYGIGYVSNMRVATPQFDPIALDKHVEARVICAALPGDAPVALFTRWDVMGEWSSALLAAGHNLRGAIVWHKPGGGMGDLTGAYILDYEIILYCAPDGWCVPGKRHGSVWNCPKDSAASYAHPTQKPVSIMSLAIQRFGPAETILDPFMGSGTTLRAAKDLGRKAIGIEIEERYCEIAAKRLAQEVLNL